MNQPLDNSNLLPIIDGLILAIEVMLMAIGNVFPWHVMPILVELRGARELRRPFAYIYGVGGIWLALAAYTLIRSAIGEPAAIPLWYVTCVIISAALGTLLPRGVKQIVNGVANRQAK